MNIFTDIRSLDELKNATQNYHSSFLVQQMVVGTEYRLLVYKGKLLGALRMIPPSVTGDGKLSIKDLIERTNRERARKILVGENVLKTLKKSGLSLDSIPQKDEVVLLLKNSRLSEGGTTQDTTDLVHPDFIRLAWEATRSVNLNLGGVDLIAEDITKSLSDQKAYLLEVNTYPDISIHYEPDVGISRPVAKLILQDIFFPPIL